MRQSKKFLIIGVLVVALLVGVLGSVAAARANDDIANTTNTTSDNLTTTLMEKIATIYQANTGTVLDAQQLEKAFEQARTEIKTEARDQMLQKLVENGKITQEQADQWKAWMDAKPNIPAIGNRGGMPFGWMHQGRSGDCLGLKGGETK